MNNMLKKADKEIFIECEFMTVDLFAMAEHLITVTKSLYILIIYLYKVVISNSFLVETKSTLNRCQSNQ